eukprot:5101594-Amphidinium_carterae.1
MSAVAHFVFAMTFVVATSAGAHGNNEGHLRTHAAVMHIRLTSVVSLTLANMELKADKVVATRGKDNLLTSAIKTGHTTTHKVLNNIALWTVKDNIGQRAA